MIKVETAPSPHPAVNQYRHSLRNSATPIICSVIFVAAFVVYAPILTGYFLSDDFGNVQLFLSRKFVDWPRLFYSDWSDGMWGFRLNELRPVIALSFIFDGFLWKANSFGYHLTNVLFHAFNSLLAFFIARTIVRVDKVVALVAGLLFALYPAHVNAVSWISGRNDVISTFFYLSSLLSFSLYRSERKSRYYVVSLILFALECSPRRQLSRCR